MPPANKADSVQHTKNNMSYSVHIEKFEGPLDLLLQLIESEKLEITEISLVQVTEPFVAHVRANQGTIPPEELADFLVIAAKLIYLKSRAILPELHDPELDEGPDLAAQLRMYKVFSEAATRIGEMDRRGHQSFSRSSRPLRERVVTFAPPEGVTGLTLNELYRRVIQRLQPLTQLTRAGVARAVTIEEKIEQLAHRVKSMMRVSFHRFMSEAKDRHEMVVAFLALLELMRQRTVVVNQESLFQDIQLEAVQPS